MVLGEKPCTEQTRYSLPSSSSKDTLTEGLAAMGHHTLKCYHRVLRIKTELLTFSVQVMRLTCSGERVVWFQEDSLHCRTYPCQFWFLVFEINFTLSFFCHKISLFAYSHNCLRLQIHIHDVFRVKSITPEALHRTLAVGGAANVLLICKFI